MKRVQTLVDIDFDNSVFLTPDFFMLSRRYMERLKERRFLLVLPDSPKDTRLKYRQNPLPFQEVFNHQISIILNTCCTVSMWMITTPSEFFFSFVGRSLSAMERCKNAVERAEREALLCHQLCINAVEVCVGSKAFPSDTLTSTFGLPNSNTVIPKWFESQLDVLIHQGHEDLQQKHLAEIGALECSKILQMDLAPMDALRCLYSAYGRPALESIWDFQLFISIFGNGLCLPPDEIWDSHLKRCCFLHDGVDNECSLQNLMRASWEIAQSELSLEVCWLFHAQKLLKNARCQTTSKNGQRASDFHTTDRRLQVLIDCAQESSSVCLKCIAMNAPVLSICRSLYLSDNTFWICAPFQLHPQEISWDMRFRFIQKCFEEVLPCAIQFDVKECPLKPLHRPRRLGFCARVVRVLFRAFMCSKATG